MRLLLAFFLALSTAAALPAPVLIALDAEFGIRTSTSAQAVQQGIELAIDEINAAGGVLRGRPLRLVTRDNRGIAAVAVDHLRELAAIPDLVAVFGGKYSPIYVECLPVAHELRMLLMDPWGSADQITDHGFRPSFSFRLSLKDEWAAKAFVRFARERHGAKRIGLLVPNTHWGRSNHASIGKAAVAAGVHLLEAQWFNWGDRSLLRQYSTLRAAGAEVLIFVTNEVEGAVLVKEVAALPRSERIPIVSHWGVTGGNFAALAGPALQALDFSVIQTFHFAADRPAARRLMRVLASRHGITRPEQVVSAVGVAHAYDLTHLLARAIDRAASTDRERIRTALERLGPYDGLVRFYRQPFTPRRHDALTAAQVFFARYQPDGSLLPLRVGP